MGLDKAEACSKKNLPHWKIVHLI